MELIPIIAQILLLGAVVLLFVVILTFIFSRNKRDVTYYENKNVDPPASLMIKQSRSKNYVRPFNQTEVNEMKASPPRPDYFPNYRTVRPAQQEIPQPQLRISKDAGERVPQLSNFQKRLTYTTGGTPRYTIINEQMRGKQLEYNDERLNPPYSRVSSF